MTAIVSSYIRRREQIETYFDRTAVQAWSRLTSTEPVGRIRTTVRAGRDRMRQLLLSWLPDDMSGMRLLDAGCGTGALAVAAAERGADVVAIDLSATLVDLARQRYGSVQVRGRLDFRSGDMLEPALGRFDFAVGMDSLIHYQTSDAVAAVSRLAEMTRRSVCFTYAPSSPALAAMHAIGTLFPRANRAPSIVPVAERAMQRKLDNDPSLAGWRRGRTERIASGFYTSQALELVAP